MGGVDAGGDLLGGGRGSEPARAGNARHQPEKSHGRLRREGGRGCGRRRGIYAEKWRLCGGGAAAGRGPFAVQMRSAKSGYE